MAAARTQNGEASHYRRRQPADSQFEPERYLAEQLNLLQVVDNQRYPAFFPLARRALRDSPPLRLS